VKPDPNYPRWMFHRTRPMVMVQNADEEAALGREWSRTMFNALPKEEKPPEMPEPEEPVEEEPAPAPAPHKPEPEKPHKEHHQYTEQPAHHTAPAAKRPPAGAVRPPVRKKAK